MESESLQASPIGELFTEAFDKIPRHDYLVEMTTSTPEIRAAMLELKKKFEVPGTQNDLEENADAEKAKKEYKALKKKLKFPEIKNQYKIICAEMISVVFKEIGYPLIWMRGHFFIWNSIYYSVIHEDQVLLKFLSDAGRKSGVPKYIIKNADFLTKLLSQLILTVFKSQKSDANQEILVNLMNGTLEISKGDYLFRPHDPEDALTYALPFCFLPDATSPRWEQHLARVLPDQSAQMLLAEHLGYIFVPTSCLKLEKVLVLFGDGANGKSVIHDVITQLLGENSISHYSLENLCDKTGYYRSMLEGRLLNYCSELSTRMNTEYFKKLASGEPVDVRSVYEKPRLILDYAKLMFNCNDLPRSIEHNGAFFRRLNILRFDITIPEAEQDKELANKIISTELPGVFNWLLQGLKRIIMQKQFTSCTSVDDQIAQYKKESDSVQLFLESGGYTSHEYEKMRTGDLFISYSNYCHTYKHKPCSNGTLGKRLKALGYKIERDNRGSIVYISQDCGAAISM